MRPQDSPYQSLTLFLAVMTVYGSALNALPAISQTYSIPAQKTIEERLSKIKGQINELELPQRNGTHFGLGWDRENFENTNGWQQGQWPNNQCGQPPKPSCPPSPKPDDETPRQGNNSDYNGNPGLNTGQNRGDDSKDDKNRQPRNDSWRNFGRNNFRSPNSINSK